MKARSDRLRRRDARLAWGVAVLLLSAACQSEPGHDPLGAQPPLQASLAPDRALEPAVPPWSPDEGRGVLSNAGTYWVSTLGPAEYPQNEEFDLVVRVLDGPTRSHLVRGAEIHVDARMPAHGHGMTHDVTLEAQPDGSWIARGLLLHMVGHWELYVDLRRGPITERAQFDIVLQ